ncbi:hypothetical protein [Desertibaculum subflavum]|uniref:hypothetical protein n=1 Tax=Desertibaculum subflavum TaxID=2268458 RepID=UPI000E666E28
MTQLGVDAIVAVVALVIWAITFLPVRRAVRRLVGEDGRSGSPMAAEAVMLVHLATLVVAMIAALDFGLELWLH